MGKTLKLFSGRANLPLAEEIAENLKQPLGKIDLFDRPDSEIQVEIKESVRSADVYIIQSISRFKGHSVNDSLVELCLMIDACRRASAQRIIAVIPYLGYARQEKMATGREAISAKFAINSIVNAGVDAILAFDLHSPAIQGFTEKPFDHLTAFSILANYCREKLLNKDLVVVSPDVGRARVGEKYAAFLDKPLILMHKKKIKGKTEIKLVAGEVKDKIPLIIDDLIAGGSIIKHVEKLLELGANPEIYISITHPAFCGDADKRLTHPAIKEIIATNTIDIPKEYRLPNIKLLSVAPVLAEAIKLIHQEASISDLYLATRETG